MNDICWAYSCVWSMVSSQLFLSFKRRYEEVSSFAFVLWERSSESVITLNGSSFHIIFYFGLLHNFVSGITVSVLQVKKPKLEESKYFAQ